MEERTEGVEKHVQTRQGFQCELCNCVCVYVFMRVCDGTEKGRKELRGFER